MVLYSLWKNVFHFSNLGLLIASRNFSKNGVYSEYLPQFNLLFPKVYKLIEGVATSDPIKSSMFIDIENYTGFVVAFVSI